MDGFLFLAGLAWRAVSPLGLALGAGGIAILAVAGLGLLALPPALSRLGIAIGATLLSLGAVYEAGYARATLSAERRLALDLALAQQRRAETAEAIARDLAGRAERDRAVIAASTRQLQDLTHAIETRPDRDRVCIPRDLARRLRAL